MDPLRHAVPAVSPTAALWAVLGGLSGCGDPGDVLDAIDPALLSAEVRYAPHIEPLYRKACVGCHDADGERSGGIELDSFEAAFATRVASACVSSKLELLERFETAILAVPSARDGALCEDWEVFSMPDGASRRLTVSEQVTLLRWIELGAPQ